MTTEEAAYHELSAYTMTHGDVRFIHQHVVDAWGAQSARPDGKPIRLIFSLAGLYLHLEKGLTGRQVQLAHIKMGRRRRAWPQLELPSQRGDLTAIDVMQSPAGPDRERAIDEWCASVWAAFSHHREAIITLLDELGVR